MSRHKSMYSKKEAEGIIAKRGAPGYVYLCKDCGWWHVTHGVKIPEDKEWTDNFRIKLGLKPRRNSGKRT